MLLKTITTITIQVLLLTDRGKHVFQYVFQRPRAHAKNALLYLTSQYSASFF